jgi:serine/threonine-protein kinase
MLDRFVAAKQISPHLAEDPKFVERFRREAQILAKLGAEGTSIVTIHDLLEEPQGLFIVMEFVQGNTLETILHDTNGPTEAKAALQILWRLAAALHVVHAAGVIHRDLKPGNIIITEGLRPKITDFGVAASRTGQTSMLLGTTKYMAPELFVGGDVDGRADLYSLGIVAYELLLGRPRFNQVFDEIVRDPHSEALRWMKWHSNEEVTAPALHSLDPNIPDGLSDIVAKMMAKKREDRFESMEALGRAIRTAFSPRAKGTGGAPAAGPAGARQKAARSAAGGAAMAEAEGDELDLHAPPITAPIPKKAMTLRTKLTMAGAAFVLLLTGVVVLVIHLRAETGGKEATARRLYQAAEANYNAGKLEDSLVLFDQVSPVYPGSTWAQKASVMSPLVRSNIAERDANTPDEWETVAAEEKAAEDQAKTLLTGTTDKVLESWLRDQLNTIEDHKRTRPDVRQLRAALVLARAALAEKRYGDVERALAGVPRNLPAEQKKQVDALRQQAALANFDKTFADLLAKGDQLAALSDPMKAMDYEGAKTAYDQAARLVQDGGTILPPLVVDAKTKDLSAKQARLTLKKRIQDAANKAASAPDLRSKLSALQDEKSALAAWPAPTDAIDRQIVQTQADIHMMQAQTAYDAGKLSEARRLAMDVLKLIPGDPRATVMIDKIDNGDKRKTLIAAGDSAFAQSKFAEALAKYVEAEKILADPALAAKIIDCRFQLMLKDAEDLVGKKQHAAAIKVLEQARTLKPSEGALIDSKEASIKLVMDYDDLVGQGDKAMAAGEYSKAKVLYGRAAKAIDTPESQKKVAEASYQEQIKSGKDALAARQGDVALGYFKLAKKFAAGAGRTTEEVDQLIKQAEGMVAP